MNPAVVIMTGIQVAKTIGNVVLTGGKAIFKGGLAVNKYLQETMPLDPPLSPVGKEDFPPLNPRVPENLNYKIKLLEDTAKTLGTPEAFSMTRGIIDQINADTFNVLIVGRVGTGKSALLNKLLERNILKSGGGETTKSLAWLIYGESGKEAAYYHDSSNKLHQISLKEINKFTNDPLVVNVFANVNAEILKHRAVLIDTPGLQASPETAALTTEAINIADAVILVVDHYPVQANDEQLIQKLKETGKGDKLFVVLNKMDNALTPEDRSALIEDRMTWLSNLGVRAHIFPLSHTDNLTGKDDDFTKFRGALVEYIDNGLDSARDASVAQRVKNTASDLRRKCEEIAKLGREQDAGKREAIKAGARERMKQFEENTRQTFKIKTGEIQRLKLSVLDKWNVRFGDIKDEVNVFIQNATGAQLNSINKLFADILADTNRFLKDEFQAAENQVSNSIEGFLNSAQLPVLRNEGQAQMNVPVRGDKINIPAEFGTIGLLAYTFFTKASHGFFATIGALPQLFLIFVLSPFINKIFEQLLKTGHTLGEAVFKNKLKKEINGQWSGIDKNVRSQISGYFDALEYQVEHFGNNLIYAGKSSLDGEIAAADTLANSGRISELDDFQRKLGDIAE